MAKDQEERRREERYRERYGTPRLLSMPARWRTTSGQPDLDQSQQTDAELYAEEARLP